MQLVLEVKDKAPVIQLGQLDRISVILQVDPTRKPSLVEASLPLLLELARLKKDVELELELELQSPERLLLQQV